MSLEHSTVSTHAAWVWGRDLRRSAGLRARLARVRAASDPTAAAGPWGDLWKFSFETFSYIIVQDGASSCFVHLSLKNLKVYFGCPIVCSWVETKAKEMEHQSTKHRCTTRCYTSGKIWVLKLSPSAWMSMTRPTDIAFLSRLRILPRIKLQNFQWKISASSPWHDDPVGVRCRPYARHFCPNNFGEVGGRRKKIWVT